MSVSVCECTLISMPYAAISRREALSPSLPLGTLSAYLNNKGVTSKAIHGHLSFLYDIQTYGDWSFVEENFRIPVVHAYGLDLLFMSMAEGLMDDEAYFQAQAEMLYRRRCDKRHLSLKAFTEKVFALRQRLSDFVDHMLATLDFQHCRVFGMSCVHGQMFAAVELARRLKAICPQATVVFGGIDCQGATASMLLRRYPFVDCVAVDEGEEALLSLIRAGGRPDGIPGLAWRKLGDDVCIERPRSPVPLDELPQPDFSSFFEEVEYGDLPDVTIPIFASRGCPWKRCTFCNIPVDQYFGYRHKAASKFADEVCDYVDRYPGCLEFVLVDDDISVSESFYKTLAEQVSSFGLLFSGHARADRLTRPMLESMKRAGFYGIEVGLEAFSQGILDRIDKGTRVVDNLKALKLLREVGIESWSNIIPFYPGETTEDVCETLEVVDKAQHLLHGSRLTLSSFTLYPRCMIWDSAESWGLREIRLAACEQLKGYRVTEGSWYTVHEFEHESAPTAELWRRVEQRLAEAERVFRSCFFRRVRDTVYVYDFRTDAHGQLTRLDGEAARLFLACVDHPRATVELVCLCPDVANARSMLSELSEAGLLFETRDRWLALPTKIYPAVRRFLADRIEVDAGLLPSPFEAAPGERGPIEERRALLIIDVQRAFLNEHTQHIASLIRQHLEAHSHEYNLIAFTVFQNREDSLFHTWHGYKGCMGSPDTDIAGELAEFATPENVFSKAGFSALSSLELLDILRTQRIGSVSLAGLDTDACILATAMDAMDHNIRPRVLLHLCASSAGPEGHRQGLEILGRSVDPWLSE